MSTSVSAATTEHDFCRFRSTSEPFIMELNNRTFDLDITGWTFVMNVYTEPRPAPPVTPTFSLTGTIQQAAATSAADPAEVKFQPTAANLNKTPGAYYYDCLATDLVPNPDIVMKGKLVILQGIGPV